MGIVGKTRLFMTSYLTFIRCFFLQCLRLQMQCSFRFSALFPTRFRICCVCDGKVPPALPLAPMAGVQAAKTPGGSSADAPRSFADKHGPLKKFAPPNRWQTRHFFLHGRNLRYYKDAAEYVESCDVWVACRIISQCVAAQREHLFHEALLVG